MVIRQLESGPCLLLLSKPSVDQPSSQKGSGDAQYQFSQNIACYTHIFEGVLQILKYGSFCKSNGQV